MKEMEIKVKLKGQVNVVWILPTVFFIVVVVKVWNM